MLYHASKEKGLKVLRPNVSTHGKPYVYAISNMVTAICFGAPKDDFDLLMDEIDGVPHIYECYPDAMKKIYSNKGCSLYEVSSNGFEAGKTGWDTEYVSDKPALVLNEVCISDIYKYLNEMANMGKCVVHRYSENKAYQAWLHDELSERIKDFGLSEDDIRNDSRLCSIFK